MSVPVWQVTGQLHIHFIIRLHFHTYKISNTAKEGKQKDCIPMNVPLISAHHAVSVLSSQYAKTSTLPVSWCLSIAAKEANN